ncbi:hypothetical protein DERP_015301, partial [Dermatophagoides pteronyssinus]
ADEIANSFIIRESYLSSFPTIRQKLIVAKLLWDRPSRAHNSNFVTELDGPPSLGSLVLMNELINRAEWKFVENFNRRNNAVMRQTKQSSDFLITIE